MKTDIRYNQDPQNLNLYLSISKVFCACFCCFCFYISSLWFTTFDIINKWHELTVRTNTRTNQEPQYLNLHWNMNTSCFENILPVPFTIFSCVHTWILPGLKFSSTRDKIPQIFSLTRLVVYTSPNPTLIPTSNSTVLSRLLCIRVIFAGYTKNWGRKPIKSHLNMFIKSRGSAKDIQNTLLN